MDREPHHHVLRRFHFNHMKIGISTVTAQCVDALFATYNVNMYQNKTFRC